ncbi:MAG: glycosyltransferase [Acidimicrobiales bacterium]
MVAPTDDPQVLVFSHRFRPDGYGRQPGYIGFGEAEDVLAAVSGAGWAHLNVSPEARMLRVRRAAGRQYRRLAGRSRDLPGFMAHGRAGFGYRSDGPLRARYDLAVFVAITVWDLPLLERVLDARRRADRVAVWFPEVWPLELADPRLALEPFALADDIFVGVADSAPILSNMLGRPVHYLPMAADVMRFAALNLAEPRPVDVLGIGRRLPALHDALLDWAAKTGRHYLYDTISGGEVHDVAAHRENLAATYRRSKLAITHFAKFDRPDEIGDQRENPGRLWEGLASGVVMAGMPPRPELQRRFPGDEVVIELPRDPHEAVAAIDEWVQQPHEDRRRHHVELALTANDWGHRWRTVFETASLPVPSGLQTRLDHLASLAGSV